MKLGEEYLSDSHFGLAEKHCYRTSFIYIFSDEPELERYGVAYSARVVVVRESHDKGHAWFHLSKASGLGVVSVASVPFNSDPVLTVTASTCFTDVSYASGSGAQCRKTLSIV